MNNILKKIQSDKVDFLINRAYNKINDILENIIKESVFQEINLK